MKNDELICPVCERGHLTPQTYSDEFSYRGKMLRVDGLEGYLCDTCGADPVFETQIRRGHAKYQDARRRADGLLIGSEIRELRKQLGLTQQQAARIFGGGANAFSKYERGDVMQSVAMDRLIRVCIRHPQLLSEIAEEEGVNVLVASASGKYVTYEGDPIKAVSLERTSNSCAVIQLEDHRRKRSAILSVRGEVERNIESSDWETAREG
ncbi:MAG: type II toxin-antitoxin system MqsA family antitoxin [Gammaproteobacteria bacterium]